MDARIRDLKESELGTRPSWEEYFMSGAVLISARASCHNVRAGSVIVELSSNIILGTGYNGAAPGIEDSCLITGCRKEMRGLEYEKSLDSGTCIGIHSEMNALGHLTKKDKGIEIYTTIFPCHDCAKNLLPYDLKKVVFKSFYSEKQIKSVLDLFQEAGVEVCRLNLSPSRLLDIIFNGHSVKFDVWDLKDKKFVRDFLKKKNEI